MPILPDLDERIAEARRIREAEEAAAAEEAARVAAIEAERAAIEEARLAAQLEKERLNGEVQSKKRGREFKRWSVLPFQKIKE